MVLMPSRDIPEEFRNRLFPVAEARAAGMSRRMLCGPRFRWLVAARELNLLELMTAGDWLRPNPAISARTSFRSSLI
jgi:hypothetical protein